MDTKGNTVRLGWKLPLLIVAFVLCIAPTIISYQPYAFTWDDSDYLARSIVVSRDFWAGNRHGVSMVLRTDIRPPIMTLLGLPWGPLTSLESAGKCFVTLNTLTAIFIALCLFLLLRIGLKPLHLLVASICLLVALGPFPSKTFTHIFATGFMADSLFAWIAFASVLLIPYEENISSTSVVSVVLRGALWAVVLSAGVLTKASFGYFVALVVPILFATSMRRHGIRNALAALGSLAVCSIPSALYWFWYGLPALKNGWAASFGIDASSFNYPLLRFFGLTFGQTPGWVLFSVVVTAGMAYLIAKRRDLGLGANVLPLLIILGYLAIGLASSNREIRYLFPGLFPLPFLIGSLISKKASGFSWKSASLAALFVFGFLTILGVPMRHRVTGQSFRQSKEVVDEAVEINAKRILLGTDSASLNSNLVKVAIATSSRPTMEADSLAWHAAHGVPIEEDYRAMRESDLVAFQEATALHNDPITNQRAVEYERYTREHAVAVPITEANGIRIYRMRDSSQ